MHFCTSWSLTDKLLIHKLASTRRRRLVLGVQGLKILGGKKEGGLL